MIVVVQSTRFQMRQEMYTSLVSWKDRFTLRDKSAGISFISWSDVEEELDLKPIAAPDGLTEEDEADLAGLFSAFD